MNDFIERVVVFCEGDVSQYTLERYVKVETVVCKKRPTFKAMFDYCDEERNNIVANAEIIFDHTLSNFEEKCNEVVALTRWDFVDERRCAPRYQQGEIMHSSKDAWIFRTPFSLDNCRQIEIGTATGH